MPTVTSVRDALERIRGPQTTITTYGPERDDALHEFLERFDVELSHERLPIPASQSYLTVRRDGTYHGSASLPDSAGVDDPPRNPPWDDTVETAGYRELTALLAGTAFTSVQRRHLLATSREIEDRAWRVGRGTLYAGFQSLSAFRSQLAVYRRLAAETALDVRVYGAPDWEPPEVPGVLVHSGDGVESELGAFWFVAFDGGGDDEMACALVAEQETDDTYRGAWTYDPAVVRAFTAYLDETYGPHSSADRETSGERDVVDDRDTPGQDGFGEQNG